MNEELPHLARKRIRLPDYDYSRVGYYFITVCTIGKTHLLWMPHSTVEATCGRPPLSSIGSCVEQELARLSAVYPGVALDKTVVMPNHVHLLLVIHAGNEGRPQVAPTVSRVIQQFKGAVTKQLGPPIWQKGFYDHIIRGEANYLRVWDYMDQNPAKWAEDRYYTAGEDFP